MSFLWALSKIRTPFLTALFQFFTLFGEEIILVVLLCALYWCIDKELAYGVSISFFLSTLLVQGLKIAFQVARPWVLDPSFEPVAAALGTATGYSFPSGHTQSAAAIFGYLGLTAKHKGVRIGAWVLVLLVGFSRMYLGVHTPQDVLCAIAISLLVSLATLHFLRRKGPPMVLAAILCALSIAVLAFAFILHGQGRLDPHYLSDCCKAAGGCIGCALAFYWVQRRIPFEVETRAPWQQGAKLAIGLAVLLLIKSGLKLLYQESLVLDAIRYFLIAIWALAVYPGLFKRLFPRKTA